MVGLGHPRRLEIELIEDRVLGLRHDRGRPHRPPRPERHAEADHPAEAVGAHQSRMPRDRRAPIMAGDDCLLGAQSIEEADHVADQMEKGILIDRLRTIALPVPAHVGRHRMEPGRGERRELMAPGVPGFGKAVAEHDQRTLAGFDQVHPDAVGLDGAMAERGFSPFFPIGIVDPPGPLCLSGLRPLRHQQSGNRGQIWQFNYAYHPTILRIALDFVVDDDNRMGRDSIRTRVAQLPGR